ncbi:MAG: trimethylamine methyltransferase family protein [Candidatus Bathyarchaeota archaeon]|nr:MAG: trimethylamine methyltransferase family protein [Candidatus Bathyarchaeota archaeon]
MSYRSTIKQVRVSKGGQLKLLSKESVREIDYFAKTVLNQTGVEVFSNKGLKVLHDLGAEVDFKRKRVWLPPTLVEEAMMKVGHSFRWGGRDSKTYLTIEGNRVHYMAIGAPTYILDLEGNYRKATIKDWQDVYRLVDALDHFNLASGSVYTPWVTSEELNLQDHIRRARVFLRLLNATEKPIDMSKEYYYEQETDYSSDAEFRIKIESLIRGGLKELQRIPMGYHHVNTTGPLKLLGPNVDSALVYAKYGLPIMVAPSTIINATGPATIAGALVQQIAEYLARAVMYVLSARDPSRRSVVICGACPGILDQRTAASAALGAPETCLQVIGTAQMGKFYKVPTRALIGNTEAMIPDAQAGYETMLGCLSASLAGINIISTGGGLDSQNLLSLEKYPMDNDMIGAVRRILDGINICDETLAVDVIDEVAKSGGPMSYISHRHTKNWMRKEQFFPLIFNRKRYSEWERAGSKEARIVARDKAKEILKEHWPEPLAKDIREKIEEYIRHIEKKEVRK